jgi:hypothetical protein
LERAYRDKVILTGVIIFQGQVISRTNGWRVNVVVVKQFMDVRDEVATGKEIFTSKSASMGNIAKERAKITGKVGIVG